MTNRLIAIIFIFASAVFGWMILGGITEYRTESQDKKLKKAVGQLWGKAQQQNAPLVFRSYKELEEVFEKDNIEPKYVTAIRKELRTDVLVKSDIDATLKLDHRKKGLIWYSTYRVDFDAEYVIRNTESVTRDFIFEYEFPTIDGIYDNFALAVDGEKVENLNPLAGFISEKMTLGANEEKIVSLNYSSQGLDEWWYVFGNNISQVKNVSITIHTNFDDIDFSEQSISPTIKTKTDNGWDLSWEYESLISGIQVGVVLPQKLNPGPFVSKISFFAPVSLFLFFFLLFIITLVKKIRIHPMNFFFLSASFFSFHLLMAYLVDLILLPVAFVISAAVSMGLVISYMRLVIGVKFALIEIGLSQFIYLVLFSSAFFLPGFTGLAITILCIVTLFALMQYTGRLDWAKLIAEYKNGK